MTAKIKNFILQKITILTIVNKRITGGKQRAEVFTVSEVEFHGEIWNFGIKTCEIFFVKEFWQPCQQHLN